MASWISLLFLSAALISKNPWLTHVKS